MKNRMKIILCLLLVCFTVIPLAACSSGDSSGEVTNADAVTDAAAESTEAASTEPERLWPEVPDTDWGGESVDFLGRTSDRQQFVTFEVYAESENGDIVNDAVYRRNRDIEEKYNVTITQNLVTNPTDEITKLVTAGDDVYDISLLVQNAVTTPSQNGLLVDLYSLDYIDFSKPWWSTEVNDRVSIHNKLYFTISDFTLVDKQRTSILFFNRDMAEEYSLGNLFDYVNDGTWTVEKMTEMSQTVSKDIDGDGDMDQHDQFGTGYERYNTAVMVFGCENAIVSKDSDDMPIIGMNTPRIISSIDKILELVANKDIAFFVEDYQTTYEGDFWGMSGDLFKDGRLMFCASFPQAFKEMSADCKDEYGVVPFPKYDETQEMYYTLSAQGTMITVPMTNTNLELAGFMLEVLSAYSSYTSLPAYYETSCKTKYMYDEESAKMLDITFDGLIFDLGQLYNWGGLFGIIQTEIPKSGQNNFASLYASAESSAQAAMEKTVDIFLELE